MRRSLARLEGEFVRTYLDPVRADGVSDEQVGGSEEKKDSEKEMLLNLVLMERRINLLEGQMNHHQHITLFQSQKRNFDSIQEQFRTMLEPALTLEATKADKREGALVRKFESSAGEYTRRLAEVEASRASSLGLVKREIDSWKGIDASRAEHFLGEIRKMKELVREESRERKRSDELILDYINKEGNRLRKDMLSLMG